MSNRNYYLTLRLDEEMFAVEVRKVREVLDVGPITKVPRTPDFLCGMFNVCGAIIPVVDLRIKFGMAPTKTTRDTRIIVMEGEMGEDMVVLGALADAVHEVSEMDESEVETAPRLGTSWDTEFIKGVGKRDGRFVILLDTDKVFTMDEVDWMQSSSVDSSGLTVLDLEDEGKASAEGGDEPVALLD